MAAVAFADPNAVRPAIRYRSGPEIRIVFLRQGARHSWRTLFGPPEGAAARALCESLSRQPDTIGVVERRAGGLAVHSRDGDPAEALALIKGMSRIALTDELRALANAGGL